MEQETGRSPKNDCGSRIGMYAATLFQGRSRSSQTTQLPYCSSPGVPSLNQAQQTPPSRAESPSSCPQVYTQVLPWLTPFL